MITLLARFLIHEKDDKTRIRQSYGVLCGIVGIALNVLLFAGKLLAGMLSNSIAITADALNNLSDAGSSLVTLIGFRLAGAKPDSEHPFGHGRMEYISGLVVAAAILLMAYELIRDSIGKILHPEETETSLLVFIILAVSILVKLYMAYYNRSIGRQIGSAAMKATATDSLSDACATTVVFAASLVGHYTGVQIDGWCGVLVGLFIMYAGVQAAKETLDPLLGQPPEKELVEEIHRIVTAHEPICGIHDLIVHDYGPGRQMISLHAEVPAEGNILETHDAIDNVEKELQEKLGCEATIHMDPIITMDKRIYQLKMTVLEMLNEIDPVITMHDFRVVTGPTHTNLIFDIIVPFKFHIDDEALTGRLEAMVKERVGESYYIAMKIDRAYVKA